MDFEARVRKISPREMAAVLRLAAPKRFQHFVRRVVDSETAFGLWNEGWVLMGDDRGYEILPLWPAPEYAEAFRTGEWADYEVASIDLHDLIDELLPHLAAASILPGIFPIHAGKSVTPSIDHLRTVLREAMARHSSEPA